MGRAESSLPPTPLLHMRMHALPCLPAISSALLPPLVPVCCGMVWCGVVWRAWYCGGLFEQPTDSTISVSHYVGIKHGLGKWSSPELTPQLVTLGFQPAWSGAA